MRVDNFRGGEVVADWAKNIKMNPCAGFLHIIPKLPNIKCLSITFLVNAQKLSDFFGPFCIYITVQTNFLRVPSPVVTAILGFQILGSRPLSPIPNPATGCIPVLEFPSRPNAYKVIC